MIIANPIYDSVFKYMMSDNEMKMDNILKYYGLESKTQLLKDWYNGYLFGEKEVYNPCSSILIVTDWCKNRNRNPSC